MYHIAMVMGYWVIAIYLNLTLRYIYLQIGRKQLVKLKVTNNNKTHKHEYRVSSSSNIA